MRPPDIRWWQALDPPIYLISILPGVAVWLLAGGTQRATAAVLPATLAVVLIQHAINVLNDVSDWRLGADGEKHASWARFHRLNLRHASVHGYLSLLAGGVLGLWVLYRADELRILAFAVPLVLLGVLYNAGPRPLSYTHLGEWVTGLCYGPGVFGCLWWLATGGAGGAALAGSLAFCALAMALLLSHQPPQIETDRQAGKLSFAVRYGAHRARQAARLLYLVYLLAFGAGLWQSGRPAPVLVAVAIASFGTGLAVLRQTPAPRRILTGATLVILIVPLAAGLTRWLAPV